MNKTKIEPCPFCGGEASKLGLHQFNWIGCAVCNKSSFGYKKSGTKIDDFMNLRCIEDWNKKVEKWRKEKEENENAAE